ncbi:MAG: cytochrome P450 [Synechococcus sp.]
MKTNLANPVPVSSSPTLLQTIHWILDPVGFMKENFKHYGDIFTAYVSWDSIGPLTFVNEPKAVQYMLTHDSGREFSAPGDVNYLLESLLGRHNLIMLGGNQHRQRRQLVMPPFHGERLHVYGKMIQSIAQEVIAQWPTNETIDVRSAMQKITMAVILQVVFGLHQGERYEQLSQLLGTRLDMTNTPLASMLIFVPWLQQDFGDWSPGAKIRRLAEDTDKLLLAEIKDRRAKPDPDRNDILSLLLAAKDEGGRGLTDVELRDELMTLLVAGHETTATALTWAIYWIHSLPEVKQRLLAEVDAIGSTDEPGQFSQASYLTAVCNETLRIHPVAMLTFPRRVEMPMELCGCQLEPGMLLMGCIYLIHHREDLYPQPQQFRPERFLDRRFSPYEFMPFGGGIRRCVGAALAQYEMKIVLGIILTQVELRLANRNPVQPGRRGVTLGPTTPVRVEKVGLRSASNNFVGV